MFDPIVMPGVTLFILICAMAVLALADLKWQKVDPWSTAALGAAAVLGLLVDGISATQWILALASAAIAFVIYLELGVHGIMGGGDIKLSPIPALVLGAINPLLALWWLCLAISIQAGIRAVSARPGPGETEEMPHVPAMFYAAVISAVAGSALFSL
jgi:Flp pilus assembly protein protease CpaA